MSSFQKRLAIQASVAFAAVILLLVGIFYFSGKIKERGGILVSAKSELASRSASLEELARLQSQYKKAKDYLALLGSAIPRESDLFNISRDFQILATQAGISHTFAFTGESPAADGGLGAVNFRLQMEGDIYGIQTFVNSLEKFKYLTRLESFSVSKTKDGRNTASIRGQIFFRK